MVETICRNTVHRFNFRFPLANFYQINELQMSTERLLQPKIRNQTQAIQSEIHSLHSELTFCPYAGYSSQLYSTLSTVVGIQFTVFHCILFPTVCIYVCSVHMLI